MPWPTAGSCLCSAVLFAQTMATQGPIRGPLIAAGSSRWFGIQKPSEAFTHYKFARHFPLCHKKIDARDGKDYLVF